MLLRRVVDQDIQFPELVHRAAHSLHAESLAADVAPDQQAVFPFGFHHGFGIGGVLALVEVNDSYVGTFAGEMDSHGAAYATVAAGDQGCFTLQFAAAAVVFADHDRCWIHNFFYAGLCALRLAAGIDVEAHNA
jgi:hypothetical protein